MDAGNWSDVPTAQGAVKTRTLLSAMADLGYSAVNVSERELAGGYEAFLETRKDSKVPLVSANLVFQSDGRPVVAPWTMATFEPKRFPALKKPLRVAIAGVTRFNPVFLKAAPPRDNVIIADPQDSLKKYLPEMRKKADQVMVLAAMSRDDAHVLARTIPGIDVIVAGFGSLSTAVEEREGSTIIVFCGDQGKHLQEVRVFQTDGAARYQSSLHYLSADYPEDPTMRAKVDQALVELNNLGRAAAGMPAAGPGAAAALDEREKTYLGVEACKECHAADVEAWASSKHALAMKTLVEHHADFNPQCVACHVVGHGKPGGFVDARSTPGLADVQCEACHGPGARHIVNPEAPYGKAGRRSCVPCHTKERSPKFEFDSYWTRIRHGQ